MKKISAEYAKKAEKVRRMVGILVHGENHFILKGPRPDAREAMEMARYWSETRIGEKKRWTFGKWEVRSKEFRENLEWAVIVSGGTETSAGVRQLLAELEERGVPIQKYDSLPGSENKRSLDSD